jgi:NADH dehydrogenase
VLAVTGANGNLGRRLLRLLADRGHSVRALVRSRTAADTVRALGLAPEPEVCEVDYLDVAAMTRALAGCTQVVHLVGILKATRANSYADAHERTASALAEAAPRNGIGKIVALSIHGADPAEANACLRSRGVADTTLLRAAPDVVILRVPMVLGEGDYASRALAVRARRALGVTLRAASLEQPIYAGDVVAAIVAALGDAVTGRRIIELAGPESLSRRALIERAAGVLGTRTRVVSLPLAPALLAASIVERFTANPPVTRAMLEVLDHDDRVDPGPGARVLGLTLTPLDEALRRVLTDA